jgi:hypothetical protein
MVDNAADHSDSLTEIVQRYCIRAKYCDMPLFYPSANDSNSMAIKLTFLHATSPYSYYINCAREINRVLGSPDGSPISSYCELPRRQGSKVSFVCTAASIHLLDSKVCVSY